MLHLRITQPLSDITIIEGRPLKLSCEIVTGLQVTVNWFHNGNVNTIFLVFDFKYFKNSFSFLVDITNDTIKNGL